VRSVQTTRRQVCFSGEGEARQAARYLPALLSVAQRSKHSDAVVEDFPTEGDVVRDEQLLFSATLAATVAADAKSRLAALRITFYGKDSLGPL